MTVVRTIVRNAAQCPMCDDIVVSLHRHDWQECSCGAIFVDGGLSYLRRGYSLPNGLRPIELSEFEDEGPER